MVRPASRTDDGRGTVTWDAGAWDAGACDADAQAVAAQQLVAWARGAGLCMPVRRMPAQKSAGPSGRCGCVARSHAQGEREHGAHHHLVSPLEARGAQVELSEAIGRVRVDARLEEDEVGRDSLEEAWQMGLHRIEVLVVASAGAQVDVQVGVLALREQVGLAVKREGRHARIVREDRCIAVALVNCGTTSRANAHRQSEHTLRRQNGPGAC